MAIAIVTMLNRVIARAPGGHIVCTCRLRASETAAYIAWKRRRRYMLAIVRSSWFRTAVNWRLVGGGRDNGYGPVGRGGIAALMPSCFGSIAEINDQ